MNQLSPDPKDRDASIRSTSPARIFVGRSGPGYKSSTLLQLRQDHAAAVDAVHTEIDLNRDFPIQMFREFSLFEVSTQANSREEYLMRPDLGRRIHNSSKRLVGEKCTACDIQIVIGDGLSSAAVLEQTPELLPRLFAIASQKNLNVGKPFFIRNCRVGILNDLGALIDAEVFVLLIGEGPGLATAQSLSAYMAYRPGPEDTDAKRNLISNIHETGTSIEQAAQRIIALAIKMRTQGCSGISVKESTGEALERNTD